MNGQGGSVRPVVKTLLGICILLTAACSGGGGGGGNNPQPPDGPLPPSGIFITVQITARTEFEPNDSLAIADAHTLPAHGANADYVGFGVFGGINDMADAADYFLFAASRDHDFTVQLCPSMCDPLGQGPFIDTSIAYVEVLDQNGTLLMSTQGDITAGNDQEVSIDAGVVYYLAVFAEDTGGTTQSYYVEMVEKLPFP